MRHIFVGLAITFPFLFGCESDEVKDLAKAQACMDAVSPDHPESADACFTYVAKHNSQQANILKCSILLTSGGLTTNKIVAAYETSNDDSITNKEAVYVSFLSLDRPTPSQGYEKAQTAYAYCVKSQVTGLEFIAGLAKVGSMLGSLAGGFDINDPAASEAAVNALLQDCVDGSSGGQSCDLADLGATVISLSDTYCSNASADKEVCSKIENAVASTGGDPEQTAAKFMCELQKKSFTPPSTCT